MVERMGGLTTANECSFLIDTAAINKRYRARQDNPYRTWTGTTNVDQDNTGETLKKTLYEACNRFLVAMEKRNWTLASKLRVRTNGIAHDLQTSLPLIGKVEYTIAGIFKFHEAPKMIRTEVPAELVKWNGESTASLIQAQKAW